MVLGCGLTGALGYNPRILGINEKDDGYHHRKCRTIASHAGMTSCLIQFFFQDFEQIAELRLFCVGDALKN